MIATKLELRVVKEPEDVSDDKGGDRLLATVEIGGALHHLEFLRVMTDEQGVQRPVNDEYEGMWDDLQALYEGNFMTIDEVAGFEGPFVCFMTPHEE
jgi:hypothetical protein